MAAGLLCAACISACGSAPTSPLFPQTSPQAPSPTPPVAPTRTRYHVSGRVTDDHGSPVPGVGIEVDYYGGGGPSEPPSSCPTVAGCWLGTRTDARGVFEAAFEPGRRGYLGVSDAAGLVHAYLEGFESNVQLLPGSGPEIMQDLRLRRPRRIDAGESMTVIVDPDSSLCSDMEDLFALSFRCEFVRVNANAAGTLIVEARNADSGGVPPSVFWTTSGNYAGPIVRLSTEPWVVSIPIRGGTYGVMAGIPVGTGTQRVVLSTSVR
jgi:hypothetical protein